MIYKIYLNNESKQLRNTIITITIILHPLNDGKND